MSYINFEAPDELKKKAAEIISTAAEKGKIKKGMNETTKTVERGIAKFVAIAGDVDPPELVFHLPLICDEKKVPYIFLNTKQDLGKSAKLKVPCSALAIVNLPKDAEKALEDVVNKIKALKK